MPFKRAWDATCPRQYDRWENAGVTWVIQDLPPEDDEAALQLLVEHLVPDETLCNATEAMGLPITNDELSMSNMSEFWRKCLKKRMSLACYVTENGKRTLAAVNCCIVHCIGDFEDFKIEGDGWLNVYKALEVPERKTDVFKHLGLDMVLYAMGLVVRRDYRGSKLGARVLSAREPLSLGQGIKATSTVFTGVASQKCAQKAGFTTLAECTMKELADSGLTYPRDDRIIKLMVKKFV